MPPLRKTPARTPRPALKLARKAVGLTQMQLAEMAGCKKGTISDLEKGRNHQPSHDCVVRIFQALIRNGLSDITMEQLFPVSDIPVRGRKARVR